MSYVKQAYSNYREYLKHPQFLAVKKIAFERDQYCCVLCGSTFKIQPHHLKYPKWGTFDKAKNIITVCYQCHCVIEGKEA